MNGKILRLFHMAVAASLVLAGVSHAETVNTSAELLSSKTAVGTPSIVGFTA
jgi:hypothetical protein